MWKSEINLILIYAICVLFLYIYINCVYGWFVSEIKQNSKSSAIDRYVIASGVLV